MNENKRVNITVGGFTVQALGVAFVVLKLLHHIDWSWWWVTAPFWGPYAVVLLLLAIWLVCAGLYLGVCWVYYTIRHEK